jgi:hypothetical protein
MDSIGQYAVRRLSVDVANLSGQLAVHQAGLEFLAELLGQLTPETWRHEPIKDENGNPIIPTELRPPSTMYEVVLPGGQSEVLHRILSTLRDLM